jgi:hypothetical protein
MHGRPLAGRVVGTAEIARAGRAGDIDVAAAAIIGATVHDAGVALRANHLGLLARLSAGALDLAGESRGAGEGGIVARAACAAGDHACPCGTAAGTYRGTGTASRRGLRSAAQPVARTGGGRRALAVGIGGRQHGRAGAVRLPCLALEAGFALAVTGRVAAYLVLGRAVAREALPARGAAQAIGLGRPPAARTRALPRASAGRSRARASATRRGLLLGAAGRTHGEPQADQPGCPERPGTKAALHASRLPCPSAPRFFDTRLAGPAARARPALCGPCCPFGVAWVTEACRLRARLFFSAEGSSACTKR